MPVKCWIIEHLNDVIGTITGVNIAETVPDAVFDRLHDIVLVDLPPRELKKIPTVCGSLREALEALKKDNAYLKAGGVFNDDFIESYIELKMQDVARFEMTPHPVEFAMYYSY